MSAPSTKWPKPFPELTEEQLAIREDFMKYWHEVYPDTYGAVAKWSHTYPLKSARPAIRTLEIGAGLGEHLAYEDAATQDYVALELRDEMAAVIREKHPAASTHVGDVEAGLDVPDAAFDRAIALHVLEHLRNLPAALDEVRRVLRPGGIFEIVIPCEGGLGYSLGRRVTSRRMFEKRYDSDFDWYIKSEHVNVPSEILDELDARFTRDRRSWWPLKVPSVNLNLCLGLTYRRP
ncbi:MAG TPA: class I SAM-dependent methyltransferase [Baekduia sp.]|uniref:class I SAM-dependent methyltransferase n=1 Tax=Baekduia sp. TaxID=2600305 RepID=UPI002BC2F3CD|nr:class I SAM-dependent methyltransferase [Baekduia sp.]HMJ34321.1 class I SAM-dependent methyltransferase [Baekduia sp.]